MICSKTCPRQTKCKPLSNVIADDKTSFVCLGLHGEYKKDYSQDRFRHCFKSETTDSIFDYDEYDLKSVMAVISEGMLIDELT